MTTVDTMLKRALAIAAGNKSRVFDWHKAARILKERAPMEADAGLKDDMFWTAGTIWRDGKPFLEGYAYLKSIWATPILCIGDEEIECSVSADETDWDADTVWPESALAIIKGA